MEKFIFTVIIYLLSITAHGQIVVKAFPAMPMGDGFYVSVVDCNLIDERSVVVEYLNSKMPARHLTGAVVGFSFDGQMMYNPECKQTLLTANCNKVFLVVNCQPKYARKFERKIRRM